MTGIRFFVIDYNSKIQKRKKKKRGRKRANEASGFGGESDFFFEL